MTLSAEGITVRANGRDLLADVDVTVAPGELLVVLGPNGAGKSTMLNTLAGDRPPTAGTIRVGETALEDLSLEQLATLRAVVSTPPVLAFDFTVREVVAMGWVQGERFGAGAAAAALEEILDGCGLEDLADRVFMTLSAGERQRVQFARGLLQLWRPPEDPSPRWLLLDEPTANLDVAFGIGLLEPIKALTRRGVGALAVIHDLDLGVRFADRVLLLDNGRTAALGAPQEVMTADRLTRVYGTPVHVEHHPHLDRLVVLS